MYWITRKGTEKIEELLVEGPDYSLVKLDGWTKIIPNSEIYPCLKLAEAKIIWRKMLRDRYGAVGDLVAAYHKYHTGEVERIFIVEKRTDRCLYGSDDTGEFKYSVDYCVVIQKVESMDD